jgi:hypothetical protein
MNGNTLRSINLKRGLPNARVKENTQGRVPLSLNQEQLAWLDQVLKTVQRGGDARVLMVAAPSGLTQGVITRALQRSKMLLIKSPSPEEQAMLDGL